MAQSSLVTYKARNLRHAIAELQTALDTASGHDHDGTDSKSITASVTYGLVAAMAAAGTAETNTVGIAASSSRTDHVHALGAHDHSGATKGGAVAMGAVGAMAASGTSTANGAGTGTTPAAIDHVHKIGDHDHSDNTKGNALALAALAADFFTADATGRGKFQTGIFDAATLLDLVAADAFSNANCDAFFAANAFAADADSRAIFADGIWTTAKLAAGIISADATGRALFAAGVIDATTAASIFADNAIPNSKVNWSYGEAGDVTTITPDASAAAGTGAGVARIDHAHAIACAVPSGAHVPDCADTEGVSNSFARADHIHALACAAPSAGLAAADAEGNAATFARSNHVHKATVTDAVDFTFGASDDVLMRWSTADADNHAFAIGLGASLAVHICQGADIATDWNVAADVNPTLYIHGATTPATEYIKISTDETTGTIQVVGGTLDLTAVGSVTVNEASGDVDFRVESNSLQYAVAVDAGKDCIVLGDNTDISSADAMVIVGNVAKTASNNGNTAIFKVVATASFTGQGTNPVMATAWFDEPNLTAGGATITNAATVYISGEPTEGSTGNYGLMVAASIGLIADAKDLVIGAGRDVIMRWSTADADNHAFAVGLGASLAMHICQAADIATDWNVAAATNPTLYIHGAATPATEYVAISTDETDAHLDAVGANWKFDIGGTAEMTLAADLLNLVGSVLAGASADNGDLNLKSTSSATDATGYIIADQLIDATANTIAIPVKAGAAGDADFDQTDINGELELDSTNGRFYFRYGAAWHYCAQTAGFEIPEYERNCPICGLVIAIGEAVIGVIDEVKADGARHGLYCHSRCVGNKDNGIALPSKAVVPTATGTTFPNAAERKAAGVKKVGDKLVPA